MRHVYKVHVFLEGQMNLKKLPRTLPSFFEFYLVNVKKTGRFRHIFVASKSNYLYEIYQDKKYHIQIQTLDIKFPLVFTFESFSKERKKEYTHYFRSRGTFNDYVDIIVLSFLTTCLYLPLCGHF